MKTFIRTLSAVSILWLCSNALRADAGNSGFGFTVAQKKLGATQQNRSRHTTETKEEWAYKVTIENKSFKDVANVEIKYITFMKPDPEGTKVLTGQIKLKRKQGETNAPLIKNFDKFSFTTDSVVLIGTQLDAGWVWMSGANPRSKDALKGLWLRMFVDGRQVAEFIDPPGLKEKETWEGK